MTADRYRSADGVIDRHTEAVLTRSAILSGLDDQDTAAVIGRLQRVVFRSGAPLIDRSLESPALFIVINGKVKVGWCGPAAPEKLLAVMGPSDIFGAETLFDPGPVTYSATALTDGVVAMLDRDGLSACSEGRPRITEQLMRILARHLRRAEDHIAELNFADVSGRTAGQLLRLAQRFGSRRDEELRLSHDLTQREMAQLVGASRESVNKALSDFANRGWITLSGKTMVIHQTEPLARRAF